MNKDVSHLVAAEYDATKEKQDNMLKFDEYWVQPNALGKSSNVTDLLLDDKQRALEAAQIRNDLGSEAV